MGTDASLDAKEMANIVLLSPFWIPIVAVYFLWKAFVYILRTLLRALLASFLRIYYLIQRKNYHVQRKDFINHTKSFRDNKTFGIKHSSTAKCWFCDTSFQAVVEHEVFRPVTVLTNGARVLKGFRHSHKIGKDDSIYHEFTNLRVLKQEKLLLKNKEKELEEPPTIEVFVDGVNINDILKGD